MSINIGEVLANLWQKSGFNAIFVGFADGGWQNLVMLIIACVLQYLGIVKKFEPLLLVGIAFRLPVVQPCPWAVSTNCGELGQPMNPASDRITALRRHHAGRRPRWISSISARQDLLVPLPDLHGRARRPTLAPCLVIPRACCWRCRTAGRVRCLPAACCCALPAPQSASIGIIGGADGSHRHFPDFTRLGSLSCWRHRRPLTLHGADPAGYPALLIMNQADRRDRKIKMQADPYCSQGREDHLPIVLLSSWLCCCRHRAL